MADHLDVASQKDNIPKHPWEHVPPAQWEDWKWQLKNRLNSVEDFARFLNLTEDEIIGLSARGLFRVDVTPYFASLMDYNDPTCPIRAQVLPKAQELLPFEAAMADSLAEETTSPVPGLVHRYPDRVLMLVTTQCASYCRFCTRSRIVGDATANFGRVDFAHQIDYIKSHSEVRDVLLSGGDPLHLSEHALKVILRQLRDIPHVEIIRIGTRVPIFLPQRITHSLVSLLRQFHPIWMNIHVNHPKEISPEVRLSLARLADAGIPLGSQTVLLAGINDCPNIMLALVHELVKNRVRPYYLYQCDLVVGAGHFRTSIGRGVEIMEALRGHTSGYAIPTYVIDAPNGGGKVPIAPDYLLGMSDYRVVIRNYEGFISTYVQPKNYQGHNPETCQFCRNQRIAKEQMSVAKLLAGDTDVIMPEGWLPFHRKNPQG